MAGASKSTLYLQAHMNLVLNIMLFGLRIIIPEVRSHKCPILFAFFLTTY